MLEILSSGQNRLECDLQKFGEISMIHGLLMMGSLRLGQPAF